MQHFFPSPPNDLVFPLEPSETARGILSLTKRRRFERWKARTSWPGDLAPISELLHSFLPGNPHCIARIFSTPAVARLLDSVLAGTDDPECVANCASAIACGLAAEEKLPGSLRLSNPRTITLLSYDATWTQGQVLQRGVAYNEQCLTFNDRVRAAPYVQAAAALATEHKGLHYALRRLAPEVSFEEQRPTTRLLVVPKVDSLASAIIELAAAISQNLLRAYLELLELPSDEADALMSFADNTVRRKLGESLPKLEAPKVDSRATSVLAELLQLAT